MRPCVIIYLMELVEHAPPKKGAESEAEYERMLLALKARGCRTTGPRRALLRLLAETREPLSVPEMHSAVNAAAVNSAGQADAEGGDEANLVTVYRFANLLVEMGLARRIEFGEGFYRYEREESQTGPHHHHMVCQKCGKIEDFDGCDLAVLISRLEAEKGFAVQKHQLELYGACADCR